MTLYLDFIWALNLIFDFILLLMTSVFVKRESPLKRLIFGSIIASLIVPLSLLLPTYFISNIFSKVVYSIIIILCAFPFQSLASFFHTLLSFYFISFLIGGGLIGIHYLLNDPLSFEANNFIMVNKAFGDPISWLFVIISFPILVRFAKGRFDKFTVEKIKYNHLYPVFIRIKGIQKEGMGFMDSGNQLMDPMTKFPVMIADQTLLRSYFQGEDWLKLKEMSYTLNNVDIPKKWQGKISFVPYRTIEGKNKILLAIKPENVSIQVGEKRLSTNKVLVGIHFSKLAQDESYNCLLQPQLFEQKMGVAK